MHSGYIRRLHNLPHPRTKKFVRKPLNKIANSRHFWNCHHRIPGPNICGSICNITLEQRHFLFLEIYKHRFSLCISMGLYWKHHWKTKTKIEFELSKKCSPRTCWLLHAHHRPDTHAVNIIRRARGMAGSLELSIFCLLVCCEPIQTALIYDQEKKRIFQHGEWFNRLSDINAQRIGGISTFRIVI